MPLTQWCAYTFLERWKQVQINNCGIAFNPNNHLIIMAGGAGSRFWPLSTEERPKQFLDVIGCGRTLLQMSLDRFKNIVPIENVYILTHEKYGSLVKEQLPEVPKENVLYEPARRNTAPCLCYAGYKIKKKNAKANIVVTPSDHLISDLKAFEETIKDAMEFSAETDAIVTIGIKPTAPETGFGYIKADLSFSSSRRENIFKVDSFKEKPTLEVAQQYIKDPSYLWNAGIFVWNAATIVNAFRIYEPRMAKIFEDLMPFYGTEQEQEKINEAYPLCESISVDYAIMEKSEEIFTYPASFGWSDLGTWSALRENNNKDKYGNASIGNDFDFHESYNNVVHTQSFKKVVIQGLDGYVVAEKDGVLLICKLSEEQRIKSFH